MLKFSVIIPVYNSVEYLRSAVESVLSQDYKNIELLLVDDGSSDGSELLCDDLASEDSRVRVFHISNGGMCHARNFALKQAKGDYIGFCDNDDYYLPGCFSKVAEAINMCDQNLDCVCYGRILKQFSAEGELIYQSEKVPTFKQLVPRGEIGNFYEIWAYGTDGVWCRFYNRLFLRKNNIFFDEKLRHGVEDSIFNLEVVNKYPSVLLMPYSYYVWLRRENHSSSMCIAADTAYGISKALELDSSFMITNGINKRNPRFYGEKLLEHMIFQIINVRRKKVHSYDAESALYKELRKIYLPYASTINSRSLPLALRIEFSLLMKERYRILYTLILFVGYFR